MRCRCPPPVCGRIRQIILPIGCLASRRKSEWPA
jgi:hypothetical protein